MGDLVYLTLVANEIEAEIVCSLLRTEGIECAHRPTNMAVGAMDGLPTGGPREVVVNAEDLDRAHEILAASRSD